MSPTNLHTFDYFWPETTAVIPTSCPSQLREMFNRLPCFERTKSPQQKTFCLGKDLNQQLISIDPIKSAIWNYLGVHWSSMFIVIVVVVMVGPLDKMLKMESKTKDEQWAGHKFSTSAKKNEQNRQQNQQMCHRKIIKLQYIFSASAATDPSTIFWFQRLCQWYPKVECFVLGSM